MKRVKEKDMRKDARWEGQEESKIGRKREKGGADGERGVGEEKDE